MSSLPDSSKFLTELLRIRNRLDLRSAAISHLFRLFYEWPQHMWLCCSAGLLPCISSHGALIGSQCKGHFATLTDGFVRFAIPDSFGQ